MVLSGGDDADDSGTSYLFVPVIYADLERQRLKLRAFRDEAEARQHELCRLLFKTEGKSRGVIGQRAGNKIRRLPSNVYGAPSLRSAFCARVRMGTHSVKPSIGGQQRLCPLTLTSFAPTMAMMTVRELRMCGTSFLETTSLTGLDGSNSLGLTLTPSEARATSATSTTYGRRR